MATWGEVEAELISSQKKLGYPDFDGVRRGYLAKLASHTGRSCIVYETAGFAPPQGATPDSLSISLDPDIGAFMEVVHGLPTNVGIDLILHSPGGTAEAAEAIVEYLRGRFPGLRVIVPVAAMSAATMIALAADEIIMGAHSQLGPIDPQFTLHTPEGPRSAPAAAIREQFRKAKEDLAQHPENTAAWLPILRSFAPALLEMCDSAEALSKSMVQAWLVKYMFAGRDGATKLAEKVGEELTNFDSFLSHARRVSREFLRDLSVNVVDLEKDPVLQDLVLSVHHAINHAMASTGVIKIVENHMGKTFLRRVSTIAMPVPVGPPAPNPGQPSQLPQQGPTVPINRQQRRANERKAR